MNEEIKKEADRLIDLFYPILPMLEYEDENINNLKIARMCAIKCIEEVLKNIANMCIVELEDDEQEWWEDVKKELESRL